MTRVKKISVAVKPSAGRLGTVACSCVVFALLAACRGEGAEPARSSAASGQERDTHAPPVAATRDAPDPTGAPDVALADRGFSVESMRAHGHEGRYQIYFISEEAVLWLSVDLGGRSGATFEAARLRDRQIAELVVGKRARNVLPAGPKLQPPDPNDRYLATGGTVRVDRLGSHLLRVSARGLEFPGHPSVSLATREVRISVPPP